MRYFSGPLNGSYLSDSLIMDWVHCNSCFILPGNHTKYFLTSCGHIYCSDCRQACTTESCKLCGNRCSTIPLSSQMKPDVEMYFVDPLELLKQYLKQVQQVAEFQNNHRIRLMMYQKDQISKLRNMKNELKKAVMMLKSIDSERQKLKKENEQLRSIRSSENCNQCGATANLRGFTDVWGTFQEPEKGPNERRSSAGSERSFKNFRDLLSPGELTPCVMFGPSRISVRTPPVNGRMGPITGTATTIIQETRNQDLSSPLSLYCTPESSFPVHHRMYSGISITDQKNKEIKRK